MRHPLHSICPYFAMFPEQFVARHIFAFTRPGDLVLDPFCGRGTTILESRLNNRNALGTDTNPVAACIAGAKAQVPSKQAVHDRLSELKKVASSRHPRIPNSEFFRLCFHPETLHELCVLRNKLNWRQRFVDRFIAAVTLGALHGESHRSENYLSNRMPRTISTKPEYSVRWWKERNLLPERRFTFDVLSRLVEFRLSANVPKQIGIVRLADARRCNSIFKQFESSVRLVVTSPPYIDTTDYSEDQWLRLWFLGGSEFPQRRLNKDDRHRSPEKYWTFLAEAWSGCSKLVDDKAVIVVRIGGNKLSKPEVTEGVLSSLHVGFSGRKIKVLKVPESSLIRRNHINSFRPGTTTRSQEHDFIVRVH